MGCALRQTFTFSPLSIDFCDYARRVRAHARVFHAIRKGVNGNDVTLISEAVTLRSIRRGRAH